eukprot:m.342087 g.342087  ORF g.342087 m.342087 type:complete len:625 (-) comp20891_c0_seq1:116-1990(-)
MMYNIHLRNGRAVVLFVTFTLLITLCGSQRKDDNSKHKSFPKFDGSEFEGLGYFLEIGVPGDTLRSEKGQAIVRIRNNESQLFECAMPSTAASALGGDDITQIDPIAATQELRNACLLTKTGWWSYEICFNSTIKQFHQTLSGKNQTMTLIGRYSHSEVTSENTLKQIVKGGDICDITMKPRNATVEYICKQGNHEQVWTIFEPKTCEYEITVVTHLLCPKKREAPAIQCIPIQENGQPYPKATRDIMEMSQWIGTYTCQGEQSFELRIFQVWKDERGVSVFTGLLGFRHIDGNGVFAIEGKLEGDKIEINPLDWVLRPENFVVIGLKGTMSKSGNYILGVVPDCHNGPFKLQQDTDNHYGLVEDMINEYNFLSAEPLEVNPEELMRIQGIMEEHPVMRKEKAATKSAGLDKLTENADGSTPQIEVKVVTQEELQELLGKRKTEGDPEDENEDTTDGDENDNVNLGTEDLVNSVQKWAEESLNLDSDAIVKAEVLSGSDLSDLLDQLGSNLEDLGIADGTLSSKNDGIQNDDEVEEEEEDGYDEERENGDDGDEPKQKGKAALEAALGKAKKELIDIFSKVVEKMDSEQEKKTENAVKRFERVNRISEGYNVKFRKHWDEDEEE